MRLRWVYDNALGKWRVYVSTGIMQGREFQVEVGQVESFLTALAMRFQSGDALANESMVSNAYHTSPGSGAVSW